MVMLLLAAIEGACRLFPHRDAGDTIAGLVIPDRDLLWRLRPFADGPLRTNELGLRGPPCNPNARFKILVLGDSVSWGDGIDDARKCYPQLLAEELDRLATTGTYQVINSGCPGYSTFQEGAYLKLYGLRLKPDLVILQFCLNDVVERYSTLFACGGDNVFLGVDTRTAIGGLRGWLVRHSRAAEAVCRGLQSAARRRQDYAVTALAQAPLPPHLVKAWAQTEQEIEDLRQVCRREQIPLLLVIAPYAFQVQAPASLRQPQDRLIAFARARGLPCVDLLPVFAAAWAATNAPLFNDEDHFSERGHRVAARALVAPVLRGLPARP